MYNEIDLDAIDTTQEPPTEEPARQYYFMAKCREWVREFERKNGRRPFAFTQTFGWHTSDGASPTASEFQGARQVQTSLYPK